MKTVYTLACLFVAFLVVGLSAPTFGQEDGNFYEIRDSMQAYYEANDLLETKTYKQFQRWEWMMSSRVAPDGDMSSMRTYWDVAEKYKKRIIPDLSKADPNWKFLGPTNVGTFARLAGRTNCIEFNPSDPNIIWVGTPNGGLWKTMDGGATWATPSDLLPNMGVTAIQINYTNTDIMYCATGDGFGYTIGADHWGGNYSNGIMKSVDGGNTWQSAGLDWDLTQTVQVFRLVMHPEDPEILFATSSNGMWKTIDGGANWTTSSVVPWGACYDLKLSPSNPDIMYASGDGGLFYLTYDGGATWASLVSPSLIPSGKEHFAVCAAEPNSVWMLGGSELYKSTDHGTSWSFIQDITFVQPGLQSGGWYYGVINIAPDDPNTIYFAGLEHGRSTDGGVTWTMISDFSSDFMNSVTPHVDSRAIEFHPNDPNTVFVATDGGIFKTPNKGALWYDLNEGMENFQLYRMGNSQSNPALLYTGAQDQGHYRMKDGAWIITDVLGDGMESVIDPLDENVVHAMTQTGYMYRSLDGGETFTDTFPTPGYGNWVTPMVFDPINNDLYIGKDALYKKSQTSEAWDYVTSATMGLNFGGIAISPQNNNYMYLHTTSKYYSGAAEVMSSSDQGLTWESTVDPITGLPKNNGLPMNVASYTGIEVSHTDSTRVWLTISGFVNGEKVYESNDGGVNWINISGSLPNIPVNCIEREGSAYNGIYIGTDLGVFYRNDSLVDWVPFMTGLPNNIVLELEVIESEEEIRACTYGRGLWKSPINSASSLVPEDSPGTPSFGFYPNPSNGIVTFEYPANTYTEGLTIRMYNTLGQYVKLFGVKHEYGTVQLVLSDLQVGQYYFQVLVNDEVLLTDVMLIAE
jgi:photosystem II stability/assembly factor-like uncharacterized protein